MRPPGDGFDLCDITEERQGMRLIAEQRFERETHRILYLAVSYTHLDVYKRQP